MMPTASERAVRDDAHPIWVFTPSRTNPADLEFILVQRQQLLQDAVERVRESALTGHKHHLLFVGPRGCGKTHLVTLLVNRLRRDATLADRLRIAWLNEDETRTSLLELLIKVHSALEVRYPDEFREEMLFAAYNMRPHDALEFVSRAVLNALGTRTLLVVAENLDAIFEQLGASGQQELRAFIQENPRLSIVATAQRLVEDLSDRTSAFFGFFQTEHLKPLDVTQATTLLQNIARLQDNADVVEFLDTSRGRARMRALHHLSGGNHRIYIVLSQFITRDSIDALLGPFMKMVDELTPYYQERIRWLPSLQRRIVEYLCVCEGAVPVKEIARRLFASPQTISSQLQLLREKGYVKANQRGRESLYEIREPLMRICVEVKDSQRQQPLRLLVDFLRIWYDDSELLQRFGEVGSVSVAGAYLESAIYLNRAEGNLRKRIILGEMRATLIEQGDAPDLLETLAREPEAVIVAAQCIGEGRQTEAIECLDEALARELDASDRAAILRSRAAIYSARGEHEKAIADHSRVVGLSGATARHIAIALVNRGVALGTAGDKVSELADYSKVVELTGAPLELVGHALFNRGYALRQLGDTQAAISDYSAAISLVNLPVDLVAKALFNRGFAFRTLGDRGRERADYTALIELRGAPAVQVAKALINRAVTFEETAELEGALADYTAAIGVVNAPAAEIAHALANRARVFAAMGDEQKAVADYVAASQLDDASAQVLAHASMAIAQLHASQGRWNDGLQALETSLSRGASGQPVYHAPATDMIGVLFAAGLDHQGRSARVRDVLRVYADQKLLAILGEAIVAHIGHVFRVGEPFPSTDNLEGWASAWENAAASIADFRLAVRLLRTGIDFVKAGGKDRGILLDVSSTERAILEQAFGLV